MLAAGLEESMARIRNAGHTGIGYQSHGAAGAKFFQKFFGSASFVVCVVAEQGAFNLVVTQQVA
jgi:hypothetical protein